MTYRCATLMRSSSAQVVDGVSNGSVVPGGAASLLVRLGCEFDYETVPGVEFLALVEPPDRGGLATLQHAQRTVVPTVPLRVYIDRFGNRCWRMTAAGDS